MEHYLNMISVQHINEAALFIKDHGVDKNNEWNEYYVEVSNNFYPFKSLIAKAYQLATSQEIDSNFHSNTSNRNKIRDLGYNIKYIKGGVNYSKLDVDKISVENKFARVTWNSLRWETPSGRKGKSRTKSYENSNGFGHEEWNFNKKYLLGEYKYGFLEPINKAFEKYSGNVYNISLYTHNGTDKNNFWITTLKNVEIPSKEEIQWVQKEYKKRGWLEEMKNDLETLGLNGTELTEWIHDECLLFNIKFKASQLFQLEEPILIEDTHILRCHRYSLMNISSTLLEKIEKQGKEHGSFENSGSTDWNVPCTKLYRNYQPQENVIEIRHGQIQQEFMRYLQTKYGKDNIKRECRAYGMSRIDLVRKTSKGYIYYEIKSYDNLLTSLRHGIGQLLEYCLYPNVEKAQELVLVSDINPTLSQELTDYINHLRRFLRIPFSYICFDPDKKEIMYSNMLPES